MDRIFATRHDLAATLLRLALGVVMFPHGAQKLLGWFGGFGPAGTIGFFSSLGIPVPLGWLGILLEFFGAILLVLGLGTRVVALGLIGMIGFAALTLHLKHGFFMNWSGEQAGEGIEYFILFMGIALALVVRGGGAWSVDRALVKEPV